MELLDSPVRVIFDPADTALVLVDFGTPMWEPVALDGEQLVQTASYVRGAGAKHFPRGNESHALSFTLARETEGAADALEARLTNSLALPRTKGDVLLAFESGTQFLLKDCAIRQWRGGQIEHLTREGLVILCGRMQLTTATYTPGDTWGA
jgi:hypothetical protein